MMRLNICIDDLTGQAIADLLQEHWDEMHSITPPESTHALDLDALRLPNITFWSAWIGHELCGCGALKELDESTGEIKSMRTAKAHRGKGIASQILEHIIQVAKERSYQCLYLETGSLPEFLPARSLYIRYGFEYCGPFDQYVEDPNSVFMLKEV